MNARTILFLAATMIVLPAHAQRSAVSADLSPADAAEAFKQVVTGVCVPAAAGDGVGALPAARDGKVQPTQDAATRKQAGAAPGETVWDVADARGVVTIREQPGRCVAAVYGPSASPTVADATLALLVRGFEAQTSTASGATQTLTGRSNGRRVIVQLSGTDPGAAGHLSQFSVVTAIVSLAP